MVYLLRASWCKLHVVQASVALRQKVRVQLCLQMPAAIKTVVELGLGLGLGLAHEGMAQGPVHAAHINICQQLEGPSNRQLVKRTCARVGVAKVPVRAAHIGSCLCQQERTPAAQCSTLLTEYWAFVAQVARF